MGEHQYSQLSTEGFSTFKRKGLLTAHTTTVNREASVLARLTFYENGRIHTRKDYPSGTGYSPDNSRQTDNTS